jgi:hypothetical protein
MRVESDVLQRDRMRDQKRFTGELRNNCQSSEEGLARSVPQRLPSVFVAWRVSRILASLKNMPPLAPQIDRASGS